MDDEIAVKTGCENDAYQAGNFLNALDQLSWFFFDKRRLTRDELVSLMEAYTSRLDIFDANARRKIMERRSR